MPTQKTMAAKLLTSQPRTAIDTKNTQTRPMIVDKVIHTSLIIQASIPPQYARIPPVRSDVAVAAIVRRRNDTEAVRLKATRREFPSENNAAVPIRPTSGAHPLSSASFLSPCYAQSVHYGLYEMVQWGYYEGRECYS